MYALRSDATPRRNTTASAPNMAFFVPPKETASTPASNVIARKVAASPPSAATAFEIRAPSRWTRIPKECAVSQMARISSMEYNPPSSVA